MKRIFGWRNEGLGFRAIASRLTSAGIPCPSGADPERNPHRLGRAWAINAVRAIVMNPKYMGVQAYGRYRKVERLRCVGNPADGHVTREVPAPSEDVLTFADVIDPIVSEEGWTAAQPGRSSCLPGPRPDRTTRGDDPPRPGPTSRYALRGLLICGECGRRMQGNTVTRKAADARVGYRCVYRNEYPGDDNHPRSLFVAENRILPPLDDWLRAISARNLEDTVAEMIEHAADDNNQPPEVRRAHAIANEAQTKLDRYMDAVEKGMDPTLYVERSRTAQRELAAARALIDSHPENDDVPPTKEQLRGLLERLGDVVGLLRHAEADERRQFYQELGLCVSYHRLGDREKIRANLGVEFLRVGGGTCPPATRGTVFDLAA